MRCGFFPLPFDDELRTIFYTAALTTWGAQGLVYVGYPGTFLRAARVGHCGASGGWFRPATGSQDLCHSLPVRAGLRHSARRAADRGRTSRDQAGAGAEHLSRHIADRRIARLRHTAAGCPTTSTGIVGNEPPHWRIPDRLSPPTGLSCRKSAAAIDAINALLSNGDSPYSPSGIHRLHIRSTYAVLYRTRFPTFPVGPRCTQECLTAVPGRTAVTVHCSMGALPTLLSIGRTPRASKSLIVSCADACTSEAAIDGADVPTLSTVATNATTTLLKILPLSKAISLRY